MIGTTVSETLLAVVVRHLRGAADGVDWATAALPDLGLDSMSAIDLVIEIEDTFGIQFPENLLVRETFGTFPALDAAVRSMLVRR